MKRPGLRGRITLIVAIGAAVALAALTVAFNLALRASLDHDAKQLLTSRATATLETVQVTGGHVRAAEVPDQGALDTLSWIYSGSRAVERPRATRSLQRQVDLLAGGPRTYADATASDVKLYAVPVVKGGRRVGTVVAGVSLEPYERTASQALLASLAFALVIFVLVVAATRWTVSRSLRPVARMTAEAAAWSDRDLDHRFNAGEPTDELTRLAATFDSMLSRLAASLRHEQRFSAEISHELRTPLTAIVAESELALARQREEGEYRRALERIAERARQLQRTLDTLVSAARAESSPRRGTTDAEQVAVRAADACAALAKERGLELTVVPPLAPLRAGVDPDAAERILAPLVENACLFGRERIEIAVLTENSAVEFVVRDDGPGVDPAERERIFEPGGRGSAAADGRDSGAGLGLALARRLARAVDGEVDCLNEARGGAFIARLPLA